MISIVKPTPMYRYNLQTLQKAIRMSQCFPTLSKSIVEIQIQK